MKLSQWAKQQGISYTTAWRWWKHGRLPVPAEQTASGTVIVHMPVANESGGVALYARVSSADQKNDLDGQLSRLTEFAIANKLPIIDAVKEVGSGMNGHRRGLLRLLRDPKAQTIIVEHRDRLMRFGFEYVESTLAAQGRRIMVIEPAEMTPLYGKRAAKNRAKKAMEALANE
jgi:putative resolvase